MVFVLKSEGEMWGREGDKVEAAVVRESDIGVDETDGGDADGWLGRSWAQYGVRLERYRVALCFDLSFRT